MIISILFIFLFRTSQSNFQDHSTSTSTPQKGKVIVYQVYKTIKHFFPSLFTKLESLPDIRKRRNYSVAELLTGAIAMFLFKETSRNAFNNDGKEECFKKNYQKIFKRRLPHMDTVDEFLRCLEDNELETIKSALVSALIEKRVFHKFKFLGKSFVIAVDATVVASYDRQYCTQCLSKTSKNGVSTYLHGVLEAKLVTSNGFSISLATEWLQNGEKSESFKKQDCELEAFKRLSKKIKKFFPRLPICIVADSLYPNNQFMEICKQMNWNYIVTLKDGCLKALQRIVAIKYLVSGVLEENVGSKNKKILRKYRWMQDLNHMGHPLHYVECSEQIVDTSTGEVSQTRFVHITNIEANALNVIHISKTGRQRWKIENEGFNTQKNLGYNLSHKYSRVSFQALKNYYQCLQIAHMINQLTEQSVTIKQLIDKTRKSTIKHFHKIVIGLLTFIDLDIEELNKIDQADYKIKLC